MFNVRVYGILINEQKQVLVSDEFIRGSYYTKFPGGGLEFGEGTRDCLKREFMEEMNLKVEIGEHIYTTDFFQLSAFNPGSPDYFDLLLCKSPGTHYCAIERKDHLNLMSSNFLSMRKREKSKPFGS